LFSGFGPFRKELSMTAESRKHSAIFATLGLFFATLFFSVLVALIANPSADELPEPGTLANSLFSLANASVWEELIVRVLMIGLPMILVDLVRNKRQAKWHSYILGGKFGIGIPEVALVLISSFIFGIAHFASGWGEWKIIPTTVGGVAFGYLFLRYGIAASIVMHFSIDYLGMPMEVIDSFGLRAITGIAVLLWIGFGALFFAYYSMRAVEFVTGRKYFDPPPPVEYRSWTAASPGVNPFDQTYPPIPPNQQNGAKHGPAPQQVQMQQYGGGFGGGYVCPVCGSVEARWVDGKFQCLTCGHLS
jgi:membrane protease YdiL (CAAX protease family)